MSFSDGHIWAGSGYGLGVGVVADTCAIVKDLYELMGR